MEVPTSRRQLIQMGACAMFASLLRDSHAAQTPISTFVASSTAEEVTAGLDLRGKTAVVTGCNSGVGYETMRVLALRGAHVIGTARTPEKGKEAAQSVQGRVTPVVLELTDFDSVVQCAEEIKRMIPVVDMLICNAGIILGKLEQVRGLEKQFVVNHLGHFILTNRLLDRVTKAPQGRIVVVGSGDHQRPPPGGIQFDRLSGEGWYARGYGHSKLANGLFSLELAKRLRGTTTTSNCATPGHVRTNILRYTGSPYRSNARTSAEGAATLCYVATNPALAKVSGEYFKDCNPAEQSALQTDAALAARLWKVSEDLTREFLRAQT